ncbi:MAG: hypothetical protein JXR64_05310 [Spirochaetales bacterium]|nr:hypothetical protein [Spirochaetales bacterium]
MEDCDRIYCANCMRCKLVPTDTDKGQVLRVRCTAGLWKKKLGEEKLYKYFTIARRTPDYCEFYEPMGDIKEFIKELKKSLPVKDEIISTQEAG